MLGDLRKLLNGVELAHGAQVVASAISRAADGPGERKEAAQGVAIDDRDIYRSLSAEETRIRGVGATGGGGCSDDHAPGYAGDEGEGEP